MEWGKFDLESRVALVPRGREFTGLTPSGENGKRWTGRYGFVALDMIGKDYFADGMNEVGLAIGLFYHPGFAAYPDYDPAMRSETMAPENVAGFILGACSSLDDVRRELSGVRVVGVAQEAIGKPVFAHWMVTEPSGESVVIEFAGGAMKIFDNPLGVITNSPTYDWHMTNLRNYVNLSSVALPEKKIDDIDFAPLGGGSGMIGLPGDNTPPSRFVRAVAWTQSARKTATPEETIYEHFRILDNFNIPLGGAEGSDGASGKDLMRSSTIWTSGWDLSNRILYYHTQHNRRVRRLKLDAVDFSGPDGEIRHLPMDTAKAQDYEDVAP